MNAIFITDLILIYIAVWIYDKLGKLLDVMYKNRPRVQYLDKVHYEVNIKLYIPGTTVMAPYLDDYLHIISYKEKYCKPEWYIYTKDLEIPGYEYLIHKNNIKNYIDELIELDKDIDDGIKDVLYKVSIKRGVNVKHYRKSICVSEKLDCPLCTYKSIDE